MDITVQREILTGNSTIGSLSVNGVFQVYTLERPMGDPLEIPADSYNVTMYPSPKFGRLVPRLSGDGVSGRDPIEIHYGNTAANSEGCILVGETRSTDFIGNSREAFDKLVPQIEAAYNAGEEITLVVLN